MICVKTLWLLPIFLAVAAAVGYAAMSGSLINTSAQSPSNSLPAPKPEPAPQLQQPTPPAPQQPPPAAAPKPQQAVSSPSGVKSIVVRLTNDGFDGVNPYRLTLKAAERIKITIKYEDKLGDFHPIFISGCEVAFPAVNPQNTESTAELTGCQPGKYAMYCLNPNCKTHDKLNGIITIE